MQHVEFNFQSWWADGASVTAILGSFFGYLPTALASIATAFALVWYLIQIYESAPVQTFLRRRRHQRLSRLRAKLATLEQADDLQPPEQTDD